MGNGDVLLLGLLLYDFRLLIEGPGVFFHLLGFLHAVYQGLHGHIGAETGGDDQQKQKKEFNALHAFLAFSAMASGSGHNAWRDVCASV